MSADWLKKSLPVVYDGVDITCREQGDRPCVQDVQIELLLCCRNSRRAIPSIRPARSAMFLIFAFRTPHGQTPARRVIYPVSFSSLMIEKVDLGIVDVRVLFARIYTAKRTCGSYRWAVSKPGQSVGEEITESGAQSRNRVMFGAVSLIPTDRPVIFTYTPLRSACQGKK